MFYGERHEITQPGATGSVHLPSAQGRESSSKRIPPGTELWAKKDHVVSAGI